MLTFIHLDEGNAVGGCVRYISNQSITLMCICCACTQKRSFLSSTSSCVYLCSFIYGSLVITLLIVPISFGTLEACFNICFMYLFSNLLESVADCTGHSTEFEGMVVNISEWSKDILNVSAVSTVVHTNLFFVIDKIGT